MLDEVTPHVRDDQSFSAVTNQHLALAWSESTGVVELAFLLNYLSTNEWIAKRDYRVRDFITVTVDGHSHLAAAHSVGSQRQAFVAMWFDDIMNDAYDQGMRPAIEDAGYTAMRIDLKNHINKIDDEIVAEIRRSRFLIADYTQHKREARGGVYWEDGFASALGLKVIRTCREDCISEVAFDTRQYRHILWETPEELRTALSASILENIGKGPNAS